MALLTALAALSDKAAAALSGVTLVDLENDRPAGTEDDQSYDDGDPVI